MTDASIGVPRADSEAGSEEPEPPVATVYVPAGGGEWQEVPVPAGETMEVTLADGRTAALVEAHDDE